MKSRRVYLKYTQVKLDQVIFRSRLLVKIPKESRYYQLCDGDFAEMDSSRGLTSIFTLHGNIQIALLSLICLEFEYTQHFHVSPKEWCSNTFTLEALKPEMRIE